MWAQRRAKDGRHPNAVCGTPDMPPAVLPIWRRFKRKGQYNERKSNDSCHHRHHYSADPHAYGYEYRHLHDGGGLLWMSGYIHDGQRDGFQQSAERLTDCIPKGSVHPSDAVLFRCHTIVRTNGAAVLLFRYVRRTVQPGGKVDGLPAGRSGHGHGGRLRPVWRHLRLLRRYRRHHVRGGPALP